MIKQAASEGLSTAKDYLKPGIVVWGLGLTLIGLCAVWPAWEALLKDLGKFKDQTGIWFGIGSTMLLGGVIPTLIHYFTEKKDSWMDSKQVAGRLIYWGTTGALGFCFIKFQTELWGTERDPITVLQKVGLDQFGYAVLINTPLVVMAYLFIDNHFSIRKTKQALQKKPFLYRFIVLLIASYAVWIPSKFVIYGVPGDLQFPFQALMIGLWGVILNLIGD